MDRSSGTRNVGQDGPRAVPPPRTLPRPPRQDPPSYREPQPLNVDEETKHLHLCMVWLVKSIQSQSHVVDEHWGMWCHRHSETMTPSGSITRDPQCYSLAVLSDFLSYWTALLGLPQGQEAKLETLQPEQDAEQEVESNMPTCLSPSTVACEYGRI